MRAYYGICDVERLQTLMETILYFFHQRKTRDYIRAFHSGATAGDRTRDLGLKRPLLYQLSYRRSSLNCGQIVSKSTPSVKSARLSVHLDEKAKDC